MTANKDQQGMVEPDPISGHPLFSTLHELYPESDDEPAIYFPDSSDLIEFDSEEIHPDQSESSNSDELEN